MSNYTPATNFTAKDSLTSGDPNKLIKGSEHDAEFSAIATAVATKYDSSDLATQAEAEAGSSSSKLMTPQRTQQWGDANGGMVGDIQALADPGADRILFWDDSAGTVTALAHDGTTIVITGTTLAAGSNVPLLNAANAFTANQTISVAGTSLLTLTDSSDSVTTQLYSSSGGANLRSSTNHALNLGTNGTDRLTLDAAGTLAGSSILGVAFSDFARLSQANIFTAGQTISSGGLSVVGQFSLNGDILRVTSSNDIGTSTDKWRTLYATNINDVAVSNYWHSGNDGASSGLDADTVDGVEAAAIVQTTGDQSIAGNKTLTGTLTIGSATVSGAVTTPHSSASEVGYQGAPSRAVTATDSTAAADNGKTIDFTSGSGQTFTLDNDPPADAVVLLRNRSGNSWSIAASGTLTFAGVTGTRTLPTGCLATASHIGSGNWYISGPLQ